MYHQTIIVGALGKDVELRYTQEGKPVASFNVAVNDYVKGEKKTAWFRVSTFGDSAENCDRYLAKGSKVMVSGRLQFDPATGSPRVYNRTDGTPGSSFELIADRVVFLSGKSDGAQDAGDVVF